MSFEQVKEILEEKYAIEIKEVKKIRSIYKVESYDKIYCLKVIKYEYPHFLFILNAIKHLQKNGFEKIPKFIKNKENEEYILFNNNFAYLYSWIEARRSNYSNPIDVLLAASKLAELHKKSEGFEVTEKMKPRIGWKKWIEVFDTRCNEILDFKSRIECKEQKTEFDFLYLSVMEKVLDIGKSSIANLYNSNYFNKMDEEMKLNGFCHHDFAHHNILMEIGGTINIIDFDYCILDTHLHDLSSLLIRVMKNGKWDMDSGKFILDSYNSIKRVYPDDIPIMAAFIEFPQDYWQVGIQYYWEKQPWDEEFFISKLKKIIDDMEDRWEFVKNFSNLKYRG